MLISILVTPFCFLIRCFTSSSSVMFSAKTNKQRSYLPMVLSIPATFTWLLMNLMMRSSWLGSKLAPIKSGILYPKKIMLMFKRGLIIKPLFSMLSILFFIAVDDNSHSFAMSVSFVRASINSNWRILVSVLSILEIDFNLTTHNSLVWIVIFVSLYYIWYEKSSKFGVWYSFFVIFYSRAKNLKSIGPNETVYK